MARPLRIELAGGLYHVTSRGDRREAIYRDDSDRRSWLTLLGKVCERHHWRCHGFCQMTNHYHLVVETPDGDLSAGMRQLNGVYTQDFNRRHGLVGHLFQGRFTAILVERDAYLLELARYVVLNPVRAGAVREAGEWPWSSYRAMVGSARAAAWLERDWVLGHFGSDREAAQAAFAAFVAEGLARPSPWSALRHQLFLGSEAFAERMTQTVALAPAPREVPREQRRPTAHPLDWFEAQYPERREAMARAYQTGVYSMQEIAQHFRVHYATVSRAVRWWESSDGEGRQGGRVLPPSA